MRRGQIMCGDMERMEEHSFPVPRHIARIKMQGTNNYVADIPVIQ